MKSFLRRRLTSFVAAATAFAVAAFAPTPAVAQVSPITNMWLKGTSSLSEYIVSGVTTSSIFTVTKGGYLVLNTGGTLSLSAGTVTGSPGIIPISLVSGAGSGSVTGMTLTLGGALTGSLTNTASVPALTLTLSTFPAASISGTLTNGQLITPTISVGGTTITLGTGATTLNSLSLSSLTVSGAVKFSGVTTPVASTSYVLQINTVSGAISTTTASAGGGGSVTQVTGTTGRVTVTSTTSTPVVTLPTTLTLSDTTMYLGSLSGTTLLGGLTVTLSGNSALNNAGTASTNFGGDFQIGTLSASNGYGYSGYVQQGYLVGSGMNQFPGGFTGPQDVVSAWWRRLYGVMTTSNSQLSVIHFGDSFGTQVWDRVDPQMFNAMGFAGLGGYDVAVTYSGTATTSTTGWTFNPAGTIETLTATNDAVMYYVNGNSYGMADTIKIFYAQQANGGTFKVQTASASPPAYSFGAFSDEAGYTAVSSSGSPTTAVITLTKSAGYAWRVQLVQTVSRSGGTTINFRPAFYSSSQSGVQTYNLSVGGISLSDSNTVSTSYLAPFLNSFAGGAPALITYHMSEGNTYLGPALETMKSTWSTSVSSTSWLIMGNPPNGTPGGAANNNPTSAQELQNGYLSGFAQRNQASGFSYYDIYGFMQNWLWLDSVQMGGDGTHISNTALDMVAAKLVRDMGITGQGAGIYPPGGATSVTYGAALPQSVNGPTITATGTTGFTMNPVGSTAPTYFSLQIANNISGNLPTSTDSVLVRIRDNLRFTSPTDSTAVLTLTASGGAQMGAAGSAIIFPVTRSAGHTQSIYIDQSGSASSLMGGNPGLALFNGNSDTYGSVIFNNGLGGLQIHSGSLSGQTAAVNLIAAGVTGISVTASGVGIPLPLTLTTLSGPITISGLLTTSTLAVTGTASVAQTFSSVSGASFFRVNAPAGSGFTSGIAVESDNNRIYFYRGNGDNGAWIDRGSTYGNGVLGIISASQSSTIQGNIVLAAGSTSGAITRAFEVAWDSATLATPLKITGTLSVSSTGSFGGAVTLGSTLQVGGASTFASVFATSISNSGTQSISGATTLGSTLVVGGLTTLNSGTLAGTFSLTGQFGGTNGIRVQSTGSTANVLTILSSSQSAARTLTLSIDAATTLTFTGGLINATSLTTSIPVGNLAAGSGASSSTFWRGDGTWATPAGGGGSGYSTASASSGLLAYSVSATTVSYGSPIFFATSGGGLNTASLSMASGTTISTSGSGTLSLSTGLNTFQTVSASSFALASQGGYFGSQGADASGAAIKDSLGFNKAIFRQQGTISLAGGSDATVTATFGAPNTASTGTTSGAAIIVGGLGVQGAIYGTASTFSAGLTGSFSSFAALNTSTSYTLTTASPRLVLFTGSNGATTHTISVDATTQQIGAEWRLVNTGTASVTLKSNGGGTLGTAYTNSITLATLNSVATTSGSYTVQRIPLLDSSGRLAPGNGTFLGPNYLDLNNGYIGSGFTVSGSVQLGANSLTSSGTIQGATLTSSGDVNATSGTIRTSAFEATGNAQFSGSSVSISSATITFSGIANTGATDFVGMVTPGSQIVSLTVLDAASLLGLPSSRTVKEDITPMSGPDAVELLGKINVVHYRYTAASGQDSTKPHIGFIAEDVANVFPEGGNTVGPKSKLVPSVSDRDLLALLFAVVQEQQKEIEKLKAAK